MSDVTDFMNASGSIAKNSQNNLFGAFDRTQDARKAFYDNQKLAAQLPFVAPQSQADLQKSQLANQYYGQVQDADINQKSAAAQNQMAAAQLEQGQAANLSQAQWNAMYQSSPDYMKPNLLAARQAAMQANPALAGTSAPGYGNPSWPPQSALTSNDISAARQANQSPMAAPPQDISSSESVLAGGQRKAPGLVPYNQTIAPQYQGGQDQQPAQSALAGNAPMEQNNAATTLFTNTPDMQQNAELAAQQAIGDKGARSTYIADTGAYKQMQEINQKIKNNPGMMDKYAGITGANKFKYDELKYGNNFGSAPPEYTTMKQLNDTYGKITPDALAKMFTGGGTNQNINNSADLMHKGFRPGSTETNTLSAQTELLNLQAMKMQPQAQQGHMAKDFYALTGADVNRDFVKNPISAEMTTEQAKSFLRSKSEEDRKRYGPGVFEMLARSEKSPAPPVASNPLYAPMGVNFNG